MFREDAVRACLSAFSAVLLLGTCLCGVARAEIPDRKIKIGILTDMSGPFADQAGRGSVVAASMAADEVQKDHPGLDVEIVSADHQNRPDLGATIVRRWLDEEKVYAVADVPNSAVAFAVNTVMHEKNRTFLASSTASSDLTGKFCQPQTVQWTLDTWALGHAMAHALMQQGNKSWFFIAFEYALGQALLKDTSQAVTQAGGKVVGSVSHPLGTTDFSSYLLQAQSSGAKVIALADTGSDVINAVKQAHEFGISRNGQQLAGLFMQITDVESMGLSLAQGLTLSEAFYWDHDEGTRGWSRKFSERMGGKPPTENQAGVYSSVLAYLHAALAADSIDGDKVVAQMKKTPIQDQLFGKVTIREDGRAIHDMFVYKVKAPSESKGPHDDYTLVSTIPADQAFRPLKDGGCPLVH